MDRGPTHGITLLRSPLDVLEDPLSSILATALLLLPVASAQDGSPTTLDDFTRAMEGDVPEEEDPDDGLDPSLPIPTLKYDRPPPDFSWELGLQMTYGDVTYWKQDIAPWVGFGLRFGWGRNFTTSLQHRLGVTAIAFVEGPMPLTMSVGVDPQVSWDFVSKGGIWLGAGVGAAAMLSTKTTTSIPVRETALAPSASARVGWSQSFSRVGRRLFVGFEGRVRAVNGNVGPQGALVLGSGKGY